MIWEDWQNPPSSPKQLFGAESFCSFSSFSLVRLCTVPSQSASACSSTGRRDVPTQLSLQLPKTYEFQKKQTWRSNVDINEFKRIILCNSNHLQKIPDSTPRSPPTHLQKQLVSFLSCCKGYTRTKGKQKNTILRDQLKLNQKCPKNSVNSILSQVR